MPSPQFWQETFRRWLLPAALVLLHAALPTVLRADPLTPQQQQLIDDYELAVASDEPLRIKEAWRNLKADRAAVEHMKHYMPDLADEFTYRQHIEWNNEANQRAAAEGKIIPFEQLKGKMPMPEGMESPPADPPPGRGDPDIADVMKRMREKEAALRAGEESQRVAREEAHRRGPPAETRMDPVPGAPANPDNTRAGHPAAAPTSQNAELTEWEMKQLAHVRFAKEALSVTKQGMDKLQVAGEVAEKVQQEQEHAALEGREFSSARVAGGLAYDQVGLRQYDVSKRISEEEIRKSQAKQESTGWAFLRSAWRNITDRLTGTYKMSKEIHLEEAAKEIELAKHEGRDASDLAAKGNAFVKVSGNMTGMTSIFNAAKYDADADRRMAQTGRDLQAKAKAQLTAGLHAADALDRRIEELATRWDTEDPAIRQELEELRARRAEGRQDLQGYAERLKAKGLLDEADPELQALRGAIQGLPEPPPTDRVILAGMLAQMQRLEAQAAALAAEANAADTALQPVLAALREAIAQARALADGMAAGVQRATQHSAQNTTIVPLIKEKMWAVKQTGMLLHTTRAQIEQETLDTCEVYEQMKTASSPDELVRLRARAENAAGRVRQLYEPLTDMTTDLERQRAQVEQALDSFMQRDREHLALRDESAAFQTAVDTAKQQLRQAQNALPAVGAWAEQARSLTGQAAVIKDRADSFPNDQLSKSDAGALKTIGGLFSRVKAHERQVLDAASRSDGVLTEPEAECAALQAQVTNTMSAVGGTDGQAGGMEAAAADFMAAYEAALLFPEPIEAAHRSAGICMDGIASIYEEQRIRAASAEPQCAGGMHWNKYAQRCLPDSGPQEPPIETYGGEYGAYPPSLPDEARGYEYIPSADPGGYGVGSGYDDGGYGQGGYGGRYDAGGYGAPDPGYGYDPMQEMGRIFGGMGQGGGVTPPAQPNSNCSSADTSTGETINRLFRDCPQGVPSDGGGVRIGGYEPTGGPGQYGAPEPPPGTVLPGWGGGSGETTTPPPAVPPPPSVPPPRSVPPPPVAGSGGAANACSCSDEQCPYETYFGMCENPFKDLPKYRDCAPGTQ